ncbi:hypothetical protein KM043_010463 [Ampulex compressa]|nr:hypothetical protein KM043_010463 [Ampulex compressa]
MAGQSYVSCIKINGFPILPPMMTEEIRESMNRYKKLAIAIEERIKDRFDKSSDRYRSTVTVKREECQEESSGDGDCPSNTVDSSESESISFDTLANTVIAPLPKGSASKVEKYANMEGNGGGTEEIVSWHKSSADDNTLSTRASLYHGSTSQAGATYKDGDESRNLEEDPKTKSPGIAEISTEAWKPRVPKTLDIIPITLNGPSCDTSLEHLKDRSTDAEDTPKLVRQGSYVLETPSPMLLAHMRTELKDYVDIPSTAYIPTRSENTMRRKEWNIVQAKAEWEHRPQDRGLARAASTEEAGRRGQEICRTPGGEKMSKSVSLQRDSEPPPEVRRTTRSVDCIRSMLVEERSYRSTDRSWCEQSRDLAGREERDRREGICEEIGLKARSRFEGAPGHRDSHSAARSGESKGETAQHFEARDYSRGRSLEDLVTCRSAGDAARSSSASERLIGVYREIQQIHERQMLDLVARQRVEQTLLQEEFEKQQMFLLEEIKKSFPEIPIARISQDVPLGTAGASESAEGPAEEAECKALRPKGKEDSPREENNQGRLSWPDAPPGLEQSSKSDPSSASVPSAGSLEAGRAFFPGTASAVGEKLARQVETEGQAVGTINGEEGARSNVRAANIINAYARGYLVRRIMKTERVVALKDTYKEALHYMLKLHVDAPLNLSELQFLHRLQLQCDAASINIVELFAQSPAKRMRIIAQDRELQRSRRERPGSARSYSFATQRTLARKKLKEMGDYPLRPAARSCTSRSRCQTWTSDIREKPLSPNILHRTIRRSTSAGTVRKPWR